MWHEVVASFHDNALHSELYSSISALKFMGSIAVLMVSCFLRYNVTYPWAIMSDLADGIAAVHSFSVTPRLAASAWDA